MADLPEPTLIPMNMPGVRRIKKTDKVLGGETEVLGVLNSPINYALQSLVDRTAWLKSKLPVFATQTQAEAGVDETTVMSPKRTKEAIDALGSSGVTVATKAEAIAGTNNTKMMTPLRTLEAIESLGSVFYLVNTWSLNNSNNNSSGIAYGNGTVFCVNYVNNPRIFRYSPNGSFQGSWNTITNARDDLQGLTFGNNELVALHDDGSNADRLDRYSATDGAFLGSISIASTSSDGIAYGNSKYWVLDADNDLVRKYATTGGTQEASWSLNSGNSDAKGITYHDGFLYVVERASGHGGSVFKYDEAGNYQSHTYLNSANSYPAGITNINGKMLVVNNTQGNHKVYEYGYLLMVS